MQTNGKLVVAQKWITLTFFRGNITRSKKISKIDRSEKPRIRVRVKRDEFIPWCRKKTISTKTTQNRLFFFQWYSPTKCPRLMPHCRNRKGLLREKQKSVLDSGGTTFLEARGHNFLRGPFIVTWLLKPVSDNSVKKKIGIIITVISCYNKKKNFPFWAAANDITSIDTFNCLARLFYRNFRKAT